MKKLLSILLALCLLLCGCQTAAPEETAQTVTYDWMAGEAPESIKRTGVHCAGMNHSDYEVTADGTYFIYTHPEYHYGETAVSPVILYIDHGSDRVIKLCGRADCDHRTEDCDAYIEGGLSIAWYDGYLYALEYEGILYEDCFLVRMDPDGTNRTVVFDVKKHAQENGYSYVSPDSYIDNGVCYFSYYGVGTGADGTAITGNWTYYYKLDGSMEEPVNMDENSEMLRKAPLYSCGDIICCYCPDGGEKGSSYAWDPENATVTYLCDHPGEAGWFGREEAYYHKDGALRRLTYATGEEEILVEDGLEGDYYATLFEDCIVVAQQGDTTDPNLYIYNWAFELVDTVTLDYRQYLFSTGEAIIAETAERFILTDYSYGLPCYYINKSELGTGNVEIHELDLTDLAEERQYFLEEFEDREWLDGN